MQMKHLELSIHVNNASLKNSYGLRTCKEGYSLFWAVNDEYYV